MKLLRAEFQNFRMLRGLQLDFSPNPNTNLTVIRAANESGKTTVLHGLQWALYGDAALPDRGEGFRLHPIDWNAKDNKRIPIMATVEFELTTYRRTLGEVRENVGGTASYAPHLRMWTARLDDLTRPSNCLH